jgi:hypothetical protein
MWERQQLTAVQRMRDGGGLPGLAKADQVSGKSGAAILEAMKSGEIPYPPMNDTMNMVLLEIGEGHAVFQGIPLLWASPEIPDTELRCKDDLGGVGWVPEGCSPGSSRSRR